VTLDGNLAYAGSFSEGASDTFVQSGGHLLLSGAATFAGGTVDGSNILHESGGSATVGDASGDDALLYDSSVSAGRTITETGADPLILYKAHSFAGAIRGFGTGDTIDATGFLLSGTTFSFAENSGGTGGTLTLHDGSLIANILMTGHYTNSSFTLAPDSGTGTLVKFV
jgi:hypothetical protein